MSVVRGLSREEKKWQAEADARTLAESQEIVRDASRRRAAVTQAKRLARDAQQQAQNLKRVASRSPAKKGKI